MAGSTAIAMIGRLNTTDPRYVNADKCCRAIYARLEHGGFEHTQLDMSVSARSHTIEIHTIWVEEDHRGEGHGGTLLRMITRMADRLGVALELEVGGYDNTIDLVTWYTRHGFVWVGGYMRREPKYWEKTLEEELETTAGLAGAGA